MKSIIELGAWWRIWIAEGCLVMGTLTFLGNFFSDKKRATNLIFVTL
jgi:hypothetical protein